jgi:DNA-binding CsgD family transcriptional regulator
MSEPAFAANARKNFHSALQQFLHTEFPGVFGPTVTRLFADRVDELYERFHPPLSRFRVGQVLWLGVATDVPPTCNQRIEDTELVPVVLDLVTAEDIDDACASGRWPAIRQRCVLRLFQQAHEQHAVLSYADVALLLHVHVTTVAHIVRAHERDTTQVVPRRGTVHDLGRSVSHKAIICYKRLVQKKSTSQVAQETYHSPEAVERYVQCLRRVQLCKDNGMSTQEIAQATGHSLSLVQEYLDLIEEFQLPPLVDARKETTVQPD